MGHNLKALVQLVLIVALLTTLGIWLVPSSPHALFWAIRFAAPALVAFCGVLLWRRANQQERLPDLLGQMFCGKYFESNGICFSAAVSCDVNRICWLNIFAQNRYAGAGSLRIVLRPPRKFLPFGKGISLSDINETLLVEGGAFVVRSIPIAMPPKYLGKKIRYQVSASSKYSQGSGAMLRFKEGMHVSSSRGTADAILLLLGAIGGLIVVSRAASITWRFPSDAASQLPNGVTFRDEVLWRPEGPIPQGFPVIAKSEARAA